MRTNSRPVAFAIDLPSEVFADARRPDQAEDRPVELVGARLHGKVLDDALLHLFEAEVLGVEQLLGDVQVLLDLGALVPRDRQQPIEIVAHHRRLCRHRRHLPQLLQLGCGLVAGFLAELGGLDALFEFAQIVLAVLVAELLLDRLHLLVEVILALGLLHLALDARADALLDLQHRDLAFHEREAFLQTLGDGDHLQHGLLVGDLDREVRRDRIGELRIILDLTVTAETTSGEIFLLSLT